MGRCTGMLFLPSKKVFENYDIINSTSNSEIDIVDLHDYDNADVDEDSVNFFLACQL